MGEQEENERGESDGKSWMPLIAVLVAIGTFFAVLPAVAILGGIIDIGMFAWETQEVHEEAERIRREAKKRQAEEAEWTEEIRKEEAEREEIERERERLRPELLEVGVGDFDAEARDEIARKLIDLGMDESRRAGLFFRAGAHELLLEQDPGYAVAEWVEVVVREGEWQRLKELNPEAIEEMSAGTAMCIAGEKEAGLTVFENVLGRSAMTRRGDRARPVGCGATYGNFSVDPYETVEGGIAQAVAAGRQHRFSKKFLRDLSRDRSTARSPERLLVAVEVHRQGELPTEKLAEIALETRADCTDDPFEFAFPVSVTPEVLTAAADAVQQEKEGQRRAAQRLRVLAALQSMLRLEHQPVDFVPDDGGFQSCAIMAAFHADPGRVHARVREFSKTTERDEDRAWAHRMLAYAHAHEGDFDAALEEMEKAVEARKSRRVPREMTWAVQAFIHLSDANGVTLPDHFALVDMASKALPGDATAKRAFRTNNRSSRALHSPGALAVFAALAPDHEEQYLDTFPRGRMGWSVYFRARAEAARWRGDSEAEASWLKKRRALHDMAEESDTVSLLWY